MAEMSWRALRAGSRLLVSRRVDLTVAGTEHIPPSGPAILAARHYHHLYDGCALLAAIPRPVYLMVALDWVRSTPGRIAMERLCRAANWPVVVRPDPATGRPRPSSAAILREGFHDGLGILEAGHLLLVFPEGYPTIDPTFTPKRDDAEFLPFQPGFTRLARLASRDGRPVPIVPVGLQYRRDHHWSVTMQAGPPRYVQSRMEEEPVRAAIEQDVKLLSGLPLR